MPRVLREISGLVLALSLAACWSGTPRNAEQDASQAVPAAVIDPPSDAGSTHAQAWADSGNEQPSEPADVKSVDLPPLAPTPKPRARDASLTEAMVAFVQGLRARDVERVVAWFPRERPLKISSVIVGRTSIPYEKAVAEMRARDREDGLYSVLVDASDPTFIQYVLDGVEWTWVGGTRFVPNGYDQKSPVYVTWRKEKGRWVIDTIGFPIA
jgi:hypothetical protein